MRILLVEDDNILGHHLQVNLREKKHLVDWVVTGADAEYMAGEVAYDLVILDLGLPDKGGLEVLRQWRQQHKNTLVLILTARNGWEERVEGFNAGADDYLCKPFHFAELEVRLQALLRRSQPHRGADTEVAGIRLDEENQHAIIPPAGETVELTGTEFRLLEYFMRNTGRLRSRQQILDTLYQFGCERESNVVEAYIRRLRMKLGKQVFQTKRMQGYIFRGLL